MFTIGRLDIGIRTRGAGTPPVPAAPVSSSAPAITGSPVVGATLSCSTGGWTGFPAPTFTYQWIWANTSTNISGATSSTYTPVSGDLGHTLKCAVTATNSQGNATANSNTTAAVAQAPVNTVAPAITGSTNVGQTLSTTNGTWSNTPTGYAYQWKWADTGANIFGATASTYLLVSGDIGHTIKCTVTATNAAGSASADSNTTGAVTSGGVSPVFTTDFTAISALPTGVSLSRATTGTYFDASGVLQTAAIDAPRFDHAWNGSAWVANGLLIEEQRTNLFLGSNDFSNAAQVFNNTSRTANATTSPDGTTNAIKLVEASGNSEHRTYQPCSTGNGTTGLLACFAKKAERNWIGIRNVAAGIVANFNLNTGVVGTSANCTPLIINYSNGWYLCVIIGTIFDYHIINIGDADTGTGSAYSYLGDGTSGVYLYGGTIQQGGFWTSYIPTTTAAVTRSADIPSSSSPLTGYLAAGPSVWEFQDEATGTIARAAYAAGAFDWPVNKWYRSMGVYPSGTDTSGHMTVGSAY